MIIARILTEFFGLDTLAMDDGSSASIGVSWRLLLFSNPNYDVRLNNLGRGRLFARTMMQEEEERDRLIEAFLNRSAIWQNGGLEHLFQLKKKPV